MKTYCLACKVETEFFQSHLMTEKHRQNQIAFLKELRKNES